MSIASNTDVKNVAYNFSDAQVKVREATSNDQGRPSMILFQQIADLSNNPSAFTEIMSIIWKRLNDHGKNWRHVYKGLFLLNFLLKAGCLEIVDECYKNMSLIKSIASLQYVQEIRTEEWKAREEANNIVLHLLDFDALVALRKRIIVNRFECLSKVEREAPSLDGRISQRRGDRQTEDAKNRAVGKAAFEHYSKEKLRLSSLPNPAVCASTLTSAARDDLLALGCGNKVFTTAAPAPSVDPISSDVTAQSVHHSNSIADPFASLSLHPHNGKSATLLNTKTPELVEKDNLMGGTDASTKAPGSTTPAPVNPFTANQRKSPTLNENGEDSDVNLLPSPTAKPSHGL